MYIVIFSSLIALLLTYQESKGQFKNGMLWGFVLITFLGCIHYDYGNDYMSYYELYQKVTSQEFNLSSIITSEDFYEVGWIFFNWIFKPLGGFFSLVAFLSIIQNVIVYRFIKKEIPKLYWALAIFVYLFEINFYLLNFSMLRQGLVVCIFLGLWFYIKEKKWWIPFIVLFLCQYIHSSAIVLVPFAFWGFIPFKRGKLVGFIFIVLLTAFWLNSDLLNVVFMQFSTLEETERYTNRYSFEDSDVSIGLGFVIHLIPFILSEIYLFSHNKNIDNRNSIISLAMIATLVIPFAQLFPLVGRLSTYFGIFQLASIPLVFESLKDFRVRTGFLSLYVLITLYDYYLFFTNGVFADAYADFHTIFSQL